MIIKVAYVIIKVAIFTHMAGGRLQQVNSYTWLLHHKHCMGDDAFIIYREMLATLKFLATNYKIQHVHTL